MGRTSGEIVDFAANTGEAWLWLVDGKKYLVDLQSLGISEERMYLAGLHSSILTVSC